MFELEREQHTTAALRDGRMVAIRPLDEADRSALLAFGRALPEDDLLYLETDFASPEIVARLVNACCAENWRQLVASVDAQVIGYGAVRRQPGRSSHVGDISLLVSAGWRRCGLGTELAREIVDAARDLQLDKLIVEMLETQAAGRAIFDRLGFQVEGRFGSHARDRQGQRHALIVMAYYLISS